MDAGKAPRQISVMVVWTIPTLVPGMMLNADTGIPTTTTRPPAQFWSVKSGRKQHEFDCCVELYNHWTSTSENGASGLLWLGGAICMHIRGSRHGRNLENQLHCTDNRAHVGPIKVLCGFNLENLLRRQAMRSPIWKWTNLFTLHGSWPNFPTSLMQPLFWMDCPIPW